MPIPVERCIVSRDLTEPRLSPDGRCIVYAMASAGVGGADDRHARWLARSSAHRVSGAATGTWIRWRMLVLDPRRIGGDLRGGRRQPVAAAGADRRCAPADRHGPERTAAAPAMSRRRQPRRVRRRRGRGVVDSTRRRFDGRGSTTAPPTSCFDPCPTPDGSGVWWQAWNVPDMPWDASRIQRVRVRSVAVSTRIGRRRRSNRSGSCRTARWSACATTADGSTCGSATRRWSTSRSSTAARRGGWANARSPCRPTAAGSRSPATSTVSVGCASSTSRRGAVDEVARGVHGQLSWQGDRLAALRSGARTPTQIVVYDDVTWERDGRRRRTVERLGGPDRWPSPTSSRSRRRTAARPRPAVPGRRRRRTGCCAGCTAARPTSGRSRSCRASRTGERRDGTCSCPTIAARPVTGARTSRRCADAGASSTSPTPSTRSRTRTRAGGARRRTRRSSARRPAASPRSVWSRARPRAGRCCDRGVPGDRPLRPRRAQPPLRAALHRLARRPAARARVAVPTSARRCTSPIDSRTPLLVLHGDTDPVVPVEQSRAFVERCVAAGGDVELVVYEGEGHGFRQPREPARRVPPDAGVPRHARSWRVASPAVTDVEPDDPDATRVHYDLGQLVVRPAWPSSPRRSPTPRSRHAGTATS